MKQLREILKEKTNPDDYLYHATRVDYAKSIKQKGLKTKPKNKQWKFSRQKVYLADTPKEAKSFNRWDPSKPKPKFTLFKVKKNNLDLKALKADRNTIQRNGPKDYEYDKPISHEFLFKIRRKRKKDKAGKKT
jgi:hypothetical protein